MKQAINSPLTSSRLDDQTCLLSTDGKMPQRFSLSQKLADTRPGLAESNFDLPSVVWLKDHGLRET